MKSDDHFNLFWETVIHKANALEISELSLPRRRQRPARYESESATPEFVDNARDYFRQIYFNAIDTVTALRRTKTWIRTTMTQKRLNNCMLLHVHKEKVDNLNIIDIANDFGCPLLVNLVKMTFKHAQIVATHFVYALKQVCFVRLCSKTSLFCME